MLFGGARGDFTFLPRKSRSGSRLRPYSQESKPIKPPRGNRNQICQSSSWLKKSGSTCKRSQARRAGEQDSTNRSSKAQAEEQKSQIMRTRAAKSRKARAADRSRGAKAKSIGTEKSQRSAIRGHGTREQKEHKHRSRSKSRSMEARAEKQEQNTNSRLP